MGTFRNYGGNERHNIEINQETLSEFKNWLVNDSSPTQGNVKFHIADDIPMSDIVFTSGKNTDICAYAIYETIRKNPDRINECINLANKNPQILLNVINIAENFDYDFCRKILENIEKRPMSDNLALLNSEHSYYFDKNFLGQPENITKLSFEKERHLWQILDAAERCKTAYGHNNNQDFLKFKIAEELYKRGDLLNYQGLSEEQRKKAIQTFLLEHRKDGLEQLVGRLDEKILTVDVIKELIVDSDKSLRYGNIRFEGTGWFPNSSSEYAKQDTSKAQTQAEKNVNILPDGYKKVRDALIKASKRTNNKSANAGFRTICQKLFDAKSFDEIPAEKIRGLLADVNLQTAQYDIANGKAKNLTVDALQQVINTDKDGYYIRQITNEDIATVERYGNGKRIMLPNTVQGLIDRNSVLDVDGLDFIRLSEKYGKFSKLSPKEKRAIISRSEVAFKADTSYFCLDMPDSRMTSEQKFKTSCRFAILASDAVQQKKDFTPEQKSELKELTGKEYTAKEILSLVDDNYLARKEFARKRSQLYREIEAVDNCCHLEQQKTSKVAEKISDLQAAFKEMQNCSKDKSFAAKDEEAYKAENVERLISQYIDQCVSAQYHSDPTPLPQLEKPSFIGSIFGSRKESERQEFNRAVEKLNAVVSRLARDVDLSELSQYKGKMLADETKEAAQQKSGEAAQNSAAVDSLTQDFCRAVSIDEQMSLHDQIVAKSPISPENLDLNSHISDRRGQFDLEQLAKMEKAEQAISKARTTIAKSLEWKKTEKDNALQAEANLQQQEERKSLEARVRTAIQKLRSQDGNNMLLEEINEGIKAKSDKKAKNPEDFDKLAMKQALKQKKANKTANCVSHKKPPLVGGFFVVRIQKSVHRQSCGYQADKRTSVL